MLIWFGFGICASVLCDIIIMRFSRIEERRGYLKEEIEMKAGKDTYVSSLLGLLSRSLLVWLAYTLLCQTTTHDQSEGE